MQTRAALAVRVAVPGTAALPPEPLRLSALDAQWVTFPLIQRVFNFVDGAGDIPPFASAVDALRESLAETAARFPPLARRIVHRPATGDAAIDCAGAGSETMAAQVTRLRGRLVLGVAMHHAVADGRSVWRFLEAWAAACCGDADNDAEPPTSDRTAIRLPGGEELARAVLHKYAPDVPMAGGGEADEHVCSSAALCLTAFATRLGKGRRWHWA
ncbi:phenolic glucoside malonyltransferase 1-like [Panicum miliaceum]|uniref:Phenolic glucoside malonyltransferase 1-like n=1 Tax=Panicum miliaceum TaxID=4540 RepID=A0A3L6RH51_PANMI|nr:phenolic glucoside malonyltransferase 1-like [Panicum miliaceum]